MPIHNVSMPNPLQASVAGMQRASRGMEQASQDIVQNGIRSAEQLDTVSLSEQAMASLQGQETPSMEESIMDLKMHQFAYEASAKVSKLESERFQAFSSIVAQHGP